MLLIGTLVVMMVVLGNAIIVTMSGPVHPPRAVEG
jgi:hypothetical protein